MMHKEFPLVSVVVLNYNGLEFLQKTVQPLLDLSYPNLEIIYVDNASTDGSVEYLKRFQNLKVVLNQKNEGGNRGRNIGILASSGDYVLLLDGDILVEGIDLVEAILGVYSNEMGIIQLPIFDVDKKLSGYYGIYFSIYGINLNLKRVDRLSILNYPTDLIQIGSATGACLFFKKEHWIKVGGYDESQPYHMDESDIGPRFYLFGYKNFLYTRRILTHLGVKHPLSKAIYAARYKYLFSGWGRAMIKNYNLKNCFIHFPILFIFQFLKALKFSVLKKDLYIFVAFCYSVGLFFRNIFDTLKERRKIQKARLIKDDLFLYVKPPRF